MADQKIIPVRGMHCASCEMLVEKSLKSVAGVKKVKASTKKHCVMVESDATVDEAALEAAIRTAGYEVGQPEERPWLTRDGNAYAELLLAAMILLALYVVARGTGLLQLSMAGGSGTTVASAAFVGLTAGFSTCMALVGGLVLGAAARYAELHPEASSLQKFLPHAFFNAGRIVGFFLLGGVLGVIGGIITPSAQFLGVLTLLVSVVMIVLGLQVMRISPRLAQIKIALPASISRAFGLNRNQSRAYTHKGAVALGALTFFLPCGFTQAMQLNAIASGSFWSGALILGAFALGTAPGLLGIGGLTSLMKGPRASLFFRTAGLAVLAFGVFNFQNGYRLTGLAAPLPTADRTVPQVTNVVMENGVQVARMKQTWDGYEPHEFVVKKGIPVRWEIDAQNPNSCSGGVSAPALGILTQFKVGKNRIDFTPQKTGEIRFTCTMGMYPGRFVVIP